jgi:hypothetical protein
VTKTGYLMTWLMILLKGGTTGVDSRSLELES